MSNLFVLIGAGQDYNKNQFIPVNDVDDSVLFIFDSLKFENSDNCIAKRDLETKIKKLNNKNKFFDFDVDFGKLIRVLCDENIFTFRNIFIISYTENFYNAELNHGIFGEKCVFIYYCHEYKGLDLQKLIDISNNNKKQLTNCLIKYNNLRHKLKNMEETLSNLVVNTEIIEIYNFCVIQFSDLYEINQELNFLSIFIMSELQKCNQILNRYYRYKQEEINEDMKYTSIVREWTKQNFSFKPKNKIQIDTLTLNLFEKI